MYCEQPQTFETAANQCAARELFEARIKDLCDADSVALAYRLVWGVTARDRAGFVNLMQIEKMRITKVLDNGTGPTGYERLRRAEIILGDMLDDYGF